MNISEALATPREGMEFDVVIVGADAGSKFDKAKKLGVRTMDEDEFSRLVRST